MNRYQLESQWLLGLDEVNRCILLARMKEALLHKRIHLALLTEHRMGCPSESKIENARQEILECVRMQENALALFN